MKLALRFTALSDVGRVRRDNQDSGYAGPHLLAVADGVGGAARGDVASSTAVQQVRRLDIPPGNDALEQLAGAIHLAHSRLADLVTENPELDGTSTTITAGLFDGTQISIAHVGDSRAYLLRDGALSQLTKDHTFVQSLVDEGRITDEEARVHPHRNLILRAVDGVHAPEPDVLAVPLELGDRLLFCSDGCCGVLEDDVLATLLATDPLDRSAPELVNASLEAGSSDNVTVVVAEVVAAEDDGPAPTPVVVGAAAQEGRPTSRTSLLRRRPVEPDTPADPEALRYAPLPPRRFIWARRVIVLLVLLALLAGAAVWGYKWSQTRYYVGVSESAGVAYVAIYRGIDVNWNPPGLTLNRVEQRSTLPLAALTESDRSSVEAGIPGPSLASSQEKIASLVARVCAAIPKKTHHKTTKKSRHPNRPGATASPTKAPTKTPTKTPTPAAPTTSATPNAASSVDCSGVS